MQLSLLCVGKLKTKELQLLADEYIKRIRKYNSIDIVEVKQETAQASEKARIIQAECDRLLERIPSHSIVWITDISGESWSSELLAQQLIAVRDSGATSLTLIIGGTFGIAQELKMRALKKISFSRFTFPHELFRVIVLEQLFRAFKIIHHEPYHY